MAFKVHGQKLPDATIEAIENIMKKADIPVKKEHNSEHFYTDLIIGKKTVSEAAKNVGPQAIIDESRKILEEDSKVIEHLVGPLAKKSELWEFGNPPTTADITPDATDLNTVIHHAKNTIENEAKKAKHDEAVTSAANELKAILSPKE